jgi:hypothetical protein
VSILQDKFSEVVSRIEGARGPFTLFGLFLREDSSSLWDVIASAPWLDTQRLAGIRYLASEVGKILEPTEMLLLSRIAPMQIDSEWIQQLIEEIGPQNVPPVERKDFVFADAKIIDAFILSVNGSQRVRKTGDSYSGRK